MLGWRRCRRTLFAVALGGMAARGVVGCSDPSWPAAQAFIAQQTCIWQQTWTQTLRDLITWWGAAQTQAEQTVLTQALWLLRRRLRLGDTLPRA